MITEVVGSMPGTDSSSCTQQDAYFFAGTFHTHKKGLAVTSRVVALFVCLISCIGILCFIPERMGFALNFSVK